MSDDNKDNVPEQDEEESSATDLQPESDDCRTSTAGPVWQLRDQATVQSASVLSPISEIAMTLGESSIATPTTRKPKISKIGELKSKVTKCEFKLAVKH
jgi:hypothetical protein